MDNFEKKKIVQSRRIWVSINTVDKLYPLDKFLEPKLTKSVAT